MKKKSKKLKRESYVMIRLSKREKDLLASIANAHGLNMSEYIRLLLLSKKI